MINKYKKYNCLAYKRVMEGDKKQIKPFGLGDRQG